MAYGVSRPLTFGIVVLTLTRVVLIHFHSHISDLSWVWSWTLSTWNTMHCEWIASSLGSGVFVRTLVYHWTSFLPSSPLPPLPPPPPPFPPLPCPSPRPSSPLPLPLPLLSLPLPLSSMFSVLMETMQGWYLQGSQNDPKVRIGYQL